MTRLHYPATHTVDHVDDYHGIPVSDPYRWLEDLNAPETQAWIEAQNALTFSYLEQIPAREAIRARLTELWDFPKFGAPFKRAGRIFQFRNSGLQNQDVLYVMETSGNAEVYDEGRVLLDPNTLSEDGTVALTGANVSRDAQWLAYAVSASGSDWKTWHVRNIETGEDLPDVIEWSKFCEASWLPDSSGFFYGRYAAPEAGTAYAGTNYYKKVYLHHLNTPQEEDVLIYERPDQKEWGFYTEVTDDGRYLVLLVSQGTDRRNCVFYKTLPDGEFVELISTFEARFDFIGNTGSEFYFLTDLHAPRGRVLAIDVEHPARENWRTLIPEAADTLEGVTLVHDEFVARYLHDAHHQLLRFGLDGTPRGEIALPALGSLLEVHGRRDDSELFYTFHSFLYPPTVYRYNFVNGVSEVLAAPDLDFDASTYETEQVFVTSDDGTQVPMFLVHRRDWRKDGQNPTLLYGYGGFNLAQPPVFMVWRMVWLEMGGVLAVGNIRGGAEYGEAWHAAGTVHQKQNVFDDFIACAEYLIEEGITSSPKLVIEGRSNGGLLVGACLTQRPDLFGAALPTVGVMDMLRFHKFTIGWAWVSDYGCADDDLEQFETLYAYSPLHNAQPASYPPTLILTGDHDDRVMPAHSYKFAAALQAAQQGDAPVLIRIQTKTGHGPGKPTAVLIQERADMWAFVAQALKMDA
ncbi:MAG: prolyl oligopeptidase family serine peptidase [Anaerolineae bacterium]